MPAAKVLLRRIIVVRVVVGEVVALVSLGLFLATVAVWAQVLGAL
jgi:hypothetical protein